METFIYHHIYLLNEGMKIPKLHPWPLASRKCDSGSKGRSLKDVLPKVKDGKGSNHNMPPCIIYIQYIYIYIYIQYIYIYMCVCVCVSSIIVTASCTHTHAHAKDHWLWRCHPRTIYICVCGVLPGKFYPGRTFPLKMNQLVGDPGVSPGLAFQPSNVRKCSH